MDTYHIDPPKIKEGFWITTVFTVIFALLLIAFMFGAQRVGQALLIVIIAAFIAAVVVPMIVPPHLIDVGLARLLAAGIAALLIFLTIISGLPLVIATALSPVAQGIQNNGGNVGAVVNMAWPFMFGVAFLLGVAAIAFWITRSIPMILLSGFMLALALFPFFGMIAQEQLLHP